MRVTGSIELMHAMGQMCSKQAPLERTQIEWHFSRVQCAQLFFFFFFFCLARQGSRSARDSPLVHRHLGHFAFSLVSTAKPHKLDSGKPPSNIIKA